MKVYVMDSFSDRIFGGNQAEWCWRIKRWSQR